MAQNWTRTIVFIGSGVYCLPIPIPFPRTRTLTQIQECFLFPWYRGLKKKSICPELTQALSGTEGDFFRQWKYFGRWIKKAFGMNSYIKAGLGMKNYVWGPNSKFERDKFWLILRGKFEQKTQKSIFLQNQWTLNFSK